MISNRERGRASNNEVKEKKKKRDGEKKSKRGTHLHRLLAAQGATIKKHQTETTKDILDTTTEGGIPLRVGEQRGGVGDSSARGSRKGWHCRAQKEVLLMQKKKRGGQEKEVAGLARRCLNHARGARINGFEGRFRTKKSNQKKKREEEVSENDALWGGQGRSSPEKECGQEGETRQSDFKGGGGI